MSSLKQQARIMSAVIETVPEWAPTYTLDQAVREARQEMGEERWQQLNAEWEQ